MSFRVVEPPDQELLTVTEAAAALGASHRAILNWLSGGELPGIRTLGGHWRVPRSGVAAEAQRLGLEWAAAGQRRSGGGPDA